MPINWGGQTKRNFTCHQGFMVDKYAFEQPNLFELILKLQSESLKAVGCLWAATSGTKTHRVPRENVHFIQASVTIQKPSHWQTIAIADDLTLASNGRRCTDDSRLRTDDSDRWGRVQ
jgi:hypothetical protein